VSVVEEATLTSVDPVRVVPGGRVWLRGNGFPTPVSSTGECSIGGHPAHIAFAARDRMALVVPAGLDGGATEIKAPWLPGATPFVDVGAAVATGLHQVDNPAIDAEGRMYFTYSGRRGQEAAVSVFRVVPGGPREPFVTGIVNVTSLTIGLDGRLYVSSRFDGRVYRIAEDGTHEVVVSDLGLACGLAFAPDGTLFVGDRSGTIFEIDAKGKSKTLVTLPASVAAFHLAIGTDNALYVTGPTLASYDRVYRVDFSGKVETLDQTFGRPQGLAFDAQGVLHVVEALAGVSGVYRLPERGVKTLVVSGARLVGLAFGADDRLVVASNETAWLFSRT
jgi:sugar lactone lactonase YvrE